MSAGPGFVGIRFCQECNNMLYPKVIEDSLTFMPLIKLMIPYHKPLNYQSRLKDIKSFLINKISCILIKIYFLIKN